MKLFFSSTTTKPTTKKSIQTTKSHKLEPPLNTSYYDQFLKATTPNPKTTTVDINSSTWFEMVPTGAINLSTVWPEDEWETINPNENDSPSENLEDVEILFDNTNSSGVSVTIDFDCQQKRIVITVYFNENERDDEVCRECFDCVSIKLHQSYLLSS